MTENPLQEKLEHLKEFDKILKESKEKIEKLQTYIDKSQKENEGVSTQDAGKILFQLKKTIKRMGVIHETIEELNKSTPKDFEKVLQNKASFTEEEKALFDQVDNMLKEAGMPSINPSLAVAKKRKIPKHRGDWLQVD